MMSMTKKPTLPDLSKLSAAEKDSLILSLYARVRVQEAKLSIAHSLCEPDERTRFLAGEANKTPSGKAGRNSGQ